MYVNGMSPNIQSLYPQVTFPVSRGTPSLNNLPLWDHKQQWTYGYGLETLVITILDFKLSDIIFFHERFTAVSKLGCEGNTGCARIHC